ncbi:PREDICTED: solute carrier organic anion transporter family member 1A5-like [Eufriesea mexicana]|uniref:solute carrier organic anion transporter family member 1A5-like n=1 Tax=Eufriesea mexicana TaxID=516756 RepID=UPI00083BDE9D|nr:PREDICTED: solute carrier organic anion transporter family member 1A5-like [Eufriesea mexicana]
MAIHLQEVVRSEVEGGLAGPANPIPSQLIDCGCGQLPCPRLARFATRRLFVGLMSWVGLIQAAAYAYLHVVGPTITRRFQFDPYVMEWVLIISDLTPFVFGVIVAYWGDRIHRAAWIGSMVLLQSVSYFIMIIPHLTHHTKVIEETENMTHMSIYADDSRDLCSDNSARIIAHEDVPCYFTFATIVVVQIISGIANIAYFALGISYLDDNTKKKHIAAFIGVLIAVKIFGVLLGSFLAWGCLRIDAVTLSPIESYREQIGAWWLGLPILTILFIVPGLLLSWFPRMLPSEVVEKAAASLLSNSDRRSRIPRRMISQKVGSSNFWPSLGRLFINKIFMCQALACTFYVMAIVNFVGFENLIAQSRFYVPKPTGMLLGFEDPMSSRLISNILKPILVGLIIIISGLVIAKAKPSARSIVGYSIIVVLLAAGIIFSLTAATCDKKPIVGTTQRGSLVLLKYCNKNCGCSNDADFRPVCDTKGTFTFYSPCHAGCTSSQLRNDITTYSGCSCVKELMGTETVDAIDGPCTSNSCQISWLAFEFGILFAYILIATAFVGDILVMLRSVNSQDKAISIGLWLTFFAIFVNVSGKILYDTIARLTCQYWGTKRTLCHLHDGFKLGNYLCYLTGSLLVLCVILKICAWFFCRDLKLYIPKEAKTTSGTELKELTRNPDAAAEQPKEQVETNHENQTSIQVEVTNEDAKDPTKSLTENQSTPKEDKETKESPLKYGPLGPGDRRTDSKSSLNQTPETQKSRYRNLDSEDELSSTDEEDKKDSSPKVAYKPLDLDSDVESDLNQVEARSRKRIMGKEYEPVYNSDYSSSNRSSLFKREFPNPDNYEDPRLNRRLRYKDQNENIDGSSKTSSFEFSRKRQDDKVQKKGDFNEVGIPVVESYVPGSALKGVKSLINQYELNVDQGPGGDQDSVRSGESGSIPENKTVGGIPLVAMASKRPSSRGQYSSGISNLVDSKITDNRPESRESVSPKASSKGSVGTLHTDF